MKDKPSVVPKRPLVLRTMILFSMRLLLAMYDGTSWWGTTSAHTPEYTPMPPGGHNENVEGISN